MQQENPSYDSIKSTCDDEEVQQTEHVVKGAEGVVINKINKLNTTHMKFDGVNQVNIYLGGEIEKTEIWRKQMLRLILIYLIRKCQKKIQHLIYQPNEEIQNFHLLQKVQAVK